MEHGVDYKTAAEAAKQKAYTINDYLIADKSGSTTTAVNLKGARKSYRGQKFSQTKSEL